MSKLPGGASMVMGAVPRSKAEMVLASYAKAGMRAFLFPASLIMEAESLSALAALARRLVEREGKGPALLALGGWEDASSAYPLVPSLPSPLSLAAGGDKRAARMAGFLLGRAASSSGIDLIFGPRLDLATDPKSRAGILDLFGEDPSLAGALGAAFARGIMRGGAAACAMAFPGCGSLTRDGRSGPPIMPLSVERLEDAELLPFARTSRIGIPAILVTRAFVPAFEPGRIPAARSSLVIEGRLRSALGYRGLVIGDALDEDPEDAARAAILGSLAGCDLTIALDPGLALEAARGLEKAVKEGEIPIPRMVIQARRMDGLLYGLTPAARRDTSLPLDGSPYVAAFAARAAERAATILRSRHEARAGAKASSAFLSGARPIVILAFLPPEKAADPRYSSGLLATLTEEFPAARVFTLPADPLEEDGLKVLSEILEEAEAEALVLSCDAHLRPAQESLIHVLEESLNSVSLIALRDPYDAAFFPRCASIGAVYGDSEAAVRAASRLASGRIAGLGRCPVRVLGLEV